LTRRSCATAVRCSKPELLGDVLPRLGDGAEAALAEGRIFVGKRRAAGKGVPISAGDEVIMYPPRAISSDSPRILADKDGMVAAYKPASIPTIADQHGAASTLQEQVAALLGIAASRLHPSSRLDVGVSGLVIFASTPAARAWLASARRTGSYARHYVGIASRPVNPAHGAWTWPIGRASDRHRRAVGGADARTAETRYSSAATASSGACMLAISPKTGRTHQIRVHAAHAGCPLVGDTAYGGPARITARDGAVARVARIALHAAWVEVPSPHGGTWRVEAAVADDLAGIWKALGGDPSGWAAAMQRC
jgi:23S rRNA pseudouridine1911/1915/1917 synthase